MRPIDFASYYERLAEATARRYGNDMLWHGTADLLRASFTCYPEVFDDIDADPAAWRARVNDYLYGLRA
jgi:hypothetical protein